MSTKNLVHFELRSSVAVARLLHEKLIHLPLIMDLGNEILTYLDANRPMQLVVSFDGVNRFGTEAINMLLRIRGAATAYGGTVRLGGMTDGIREAFSILRLDGTIFDIFSTTDDAVASFQ